jgi:Lon-like protease
MQTTINAEAPASISVIGMLRAGALYLVTDAPPSSLIQIKAWYMFTLGHWSLDLVQEGIIMDRRSHLHGLRKFLMAFLGTTVLCYGLLFMKTPYYVYMPGTVEDIGSMVKLGDETGEREGAFYLTTVLMANANWFSVMAAPFDKNKELRPKQTVLQGRTVKEYEQRQDYVMLHSQSDSIQAAYKEADIPYKIQPQGIMVLSTLEGYDASKVLQPGDRLVSVEGMPVSSVAELQGRMIGLKPEDELEVVYERKGRSVQTRLILGASRKDEAVPQLGISAADLLAVVADDPNRQVTIQAGNIGGPSAGFMFAMEIYDRLQSEDWTKGYRIAGTGSIKPDGAICSIGGIRQKITAAEKAGVDIFFTPTDKQPPECNLAAPAANASEAADQAKKIKANIRIVPVNTLHEAIDYLRALPSKNDAPSG